MNDIPPAIPLKISSDREENIPELPTKKSRNTIFIESNKPGILSAKPKNIDIIPILPDKRVKHKSDEEINISLGIVKKAPLPMPRPSVKHSQSSNIDTPSPKSPITPFLSSPPHNSIRSNFNEEFSNSKSELKMRPIKPPRNNLNSHTASTFKPFEKLPHQPASNVNNFLIKSEERHQTDVTYLNNVEKYNEPLIERTPIQNADSVKLSNNELLLLQTSDNLNRNILQYEKYKAKEAFLLGKPIPPPRSSTIPLYLNLACSSEQEGPSRRKSLFDLEKQMSRSHDDLTASNNQDLKIKNNEIISTNITNTNNITSKHNNVINEDSTSTSFNKINNKILIFSNDNINNTANNFGTINNQNAVSDNISIFNTTFTNNVDIKASNFKSLMVSATNDMAVSNKLCKESIEMKVDLSSNCKPSELKDSTGKTKVKQLADLLANQLSQNSIMFGGIASPYNTESLRKYHEEKNLKDLRHSVDTFSPSERSPKLPVNENLAGNNNFDSDDQLSDSEDICTEDFAEQLEFSRPSVNVLLKSVPIVPNQPHLVTERKGYLYKFTGERPKLSSKLTSTWQKKWVTLDSYAFRYFNNNKTGISRKVIPVCTMCNVKQEILMNEQHSFQFKIFTFDKRVFIFSAESADDLAWWTNMIMRAIIGDKAEKLVEGGHMSHPEMQGYAKIEGIRGNLFLAKKKSKFCIYSSYTDFKGFSPIHIVDLQLANVKDLGKFKLQMKMPQATLLILFETQEELLSWKLALEAGISYALGDDEFLNKIYSNMSNRFCADCQAEGPEWAAINFGITLCQNCAGIHRKLSNAKVRSMRMDSKIWKRPGPIELMIEIGNSNANKFWLANIDDLQKINSDADITKRDEFVHNKYVTRSFATLIKEPLSKLNQMLFTNVQTSNILLTMRILHSGAQINTVINDKTALQLAEEADQKLQIELLKFNMNQSDFQTL